MNVSDLLQDSPSQHRRRPSASQHDPPSSASASASSQPAPAGYYAHSPFSRAEPAPVHRITPRPPPPPPPPSIDNAPAMASLQHPSPPHVLTHAPWGPPLPPRQGSSPLGRPSLMPDRSPVAQRTSGPSTPSHTVTAHLAAHSPPAKQLPPGTVLTPSGTLLLDKRTADEQKARLAAQPSPAKQRDDQRERERQQDMDFIRQIARERAIPPPDRAPHHHDRPPPHAHRMSPLARPPPHLQHPQRIPLFPPPHDRDRLQPPPLPHPHPHRPQPPLLPGQGQFQTHPPDWDRDIGPPRDRDRDVDRDVTRDPEFPFHPEHDPRAPPPRHRREADAVFLPPRDAIPQRDRDRDRIQRETERDPMSIDPQRERDMAIMRDREHRERDREFHMQREAAAVALHREREMAGPGVPPPRTHDRDRGRDRERERRAHSRIPSPLRMTPAIPPMPSGNTTSSHLPPHPHDVPRDRDIHMMSERDRELLWERDREREMMERRQYRDRMPPIHNDRDRDRALVERGMPLPERDRFVADRERAMHERDRALFDRERLLMPDRDRALSERDKDRDRMLVERDRAFVERERALLDRERVVGNEQRFDRDHRLPNERDRDRDRPDAHRVDVLERDRVEMFERDRDRERMEMMERERAGEKMVVDVQIEREREDRHLPGQDREMAERQRETLVERDATDRERERNDMADRERTDGEHERSNVLGRGRERLEMLDRERFELLERERLGGLDVMERERLEMLERERFEILERERLEMLEREMLERMPNAADLAKARKEREDRPFVSLGTYVWPRTPFPYYFPEWIPLPDVAKTEVGENTTSEAGPSTVATSPPAIATELRLTVLVPSTFLPSSRPARFRLWGGGLPPPPPFLPPSAVASSFARRRVYTDDSDVIHCAVHAGLLTWGAVARAKKDGRTIKIVLSLIPTLASASAAVRGVQNEKGLTMNGVGLVNGGNASGHVSGTTSVPRTCTNTPLPPPPHPPPAASVPSTSSSSSATDAALPVYAGGVWASRFIGGWGESFYGDPSAGRGENATRMTRFEEAEDDGRGCVSCGWGWGHDGSAFEVISVEIAEKNAHVAPGLGIRNRGQRLAEYAQRCADMFSSSYSPSLPLANVTNTGKRRRVQVDGEEVKNAGAGYVSVMVEEARKMEARTICFGVGDVERGRTGVGYKYDAQIVQRALFPHLFQDETTATVGLPLLPRKKRRKASETTDDVDREDDDDDDGDNGLGLGLGVVLESAKETFLVSRSEGEGEDARYTLAVFGPVSDADAHERLQPVVEGQSGAAKPEEASARKGTEGDARPTSASHMARTDATPDSNPNRKPLSTPTKPAPKPNVRTLRTGLSSSDFCFDADGVVVSHNKGEDKRKNAGANDDGVQGSMVDADIGGGDEEDMKIEVVRWRWCVDSEV